MKQQTIGLLAACLTALLWGFLAIALKVSLTTLDSFTIVWFRFTFAFIVLFISLLIFKKGKLQVFKSIPWEFILCGILLGFNYIGFMKGIEYTSPSTTQIIIQIGPLILAVIGLSYFKETIAFKQILGFVLALIGFGLFYFDGLSHMLNTDLFNSGALWIIFGAISWSFYAFLQKKSAHKISSQEGNLIIYGSASLMFIAFCNFTSLVMVKTHEWPLIIFLGLNTLLAYGALAIALSKAPANKISIIITLNPLITIFGMNLLAFLGVDWIEPETISTKGYLGALLVLVGALLVTFFRKKS